MLVGLHYFRLSVSAGMGRGTLREADGQEDDFLLLAQARRLLHSQIGQVQNDPLRQRPFRPRQHAQVQLRRANCRLRVEQSARLLSRSLLTKHQMHISDTYTPPTNKLLPLSFGAILYTTPLYSQLTLCTYRRRLSRYNCCKRRICTKIRQQCC